MNVHVHVHSYQIMCLFYLHVYIVYILCVDQFRVSVNVHVLHIHVHLYTYYHWSPSETLVDAHGRTYYMDHRTHTMAFEQGRRPQSDMTRERELLERRSETIALHTDTNM